MKFNSNSTTVESIKSIITIERTTIEFFDNAVELSREELAFIAKSCQ